MNILINHGSLKLIHDTLTDATRKHCLKCINTDPYYGKAIVSLMMLLTMAS